MDKKRMTLGAFGAVVACMSAVACTGGGSSGNPNSPANPGGGGSNASCRTAAGSTRSVQTFSATGQVVTTDLSCTFNGSTDVNCQGSFNDSVGGPGTITQTTRFASKNDLVDEAAVNPPRSYSLGTTTVVTILSVPFTTTATNSYDAQRRLTSTVTAPPPPVPSTSMTFSAWDSSGRPTAGSSTIGGVISFTYDNTNHTVTRNIPPNTCTVTHDQNGIITGETCTGTQPSTTIVTINSTVQICK